MRLRPKAFELDSGCGHTDLMQRARRHQRFSAGLAFGLLALIAELFGRSLTHRLNVGQHVSSSGYSGAEYYPFLLAAVKLLVALLLARLAWRFVRAHTAARAGRRVLAAVGKDAAPLPRPRFDLSPRLWALAFLTTSTFYLVQADAEQAASGRWPLFAPWLHTSALPVFAVLAVLVAVAWGAVASWLREYERYAEDTCARAGRIGHGGGELPRDPARPADRGRPERALRPRLREPTASPDRVTRGQRPEPAGPCRPDLGRWNEHTTHLGASTRPFPHCPDAARSRARPADDARRGRVGLPAALPADRPAPARAGLLVAARRAAAAGRSAPGSCSRC